METSPGTPEDSFDMEVEMHHSSNEKVSVPGMNATELMDIEKDACRAKNLVECSLQTPSCMTIYAKQLAETMSKYPFQSYDDAHPAHRCFSIKVCDALTENIPKGVVDVVFRLAALVEAYEIAADNGSSVAMSIISELVNCAWHDDREFVRTRACRLMAEVLAVETEHRSNNSCTASAATFEDATPLVSDDEFDLDEDVITIEDVIRPKAPMAQRRLEKNQTGVVNERTLRAIGWATILAHLRTDRSVEVRCAAVRAMSFLPDVKVALNSDTEGVTEPVYPDELVLESLFDENPLVRAVSVDSFAFTSKRTVDKAIDALETETDMAICLRLLKRLETDVNVHSYDPKQRSRLIDIVFGENTDCVDADRKTLCAMAGLHLMPRWLTELSLDGVLRLSTVLEIVDPLQKKEIAEKAFVAAALANQKAAVGDAGVAAWIVHLRNSLTQMGRHTFDTLLTVKEDIVRVVGGGTISELPQLCQRLFLLRCLVEYCAKRSPVSEREDVVWRFLPTMCEFATAANAFVKTIARDPSQLLNENMQQLRMQEFVVAEICAILRIVDRTEPAGRKAWRELLMLLIRERWVLQNRDTLASVMMDIVDHTTESREEAAEVIDEVAYLIHSILWGFDNDDDSMPENEGEIRVEVVPRCAILLEAMVRNSSVRDYSPVLVNLVLRLGVEAIQVKEARPTACRIIAIAACMNNEILLAHAHILAVLPSTLGICAETKVACLLGLGELVGIHGFKRVASALYSDIEEDDAADDRQRQAILGEKMSRLVKVFEEAIVDEESDVRIAAVEQGIRAMITCEGSWATLLGRVLVAAHTPGAPPIIRAMLNTYCQLDIRNDVGDRVFMASSMLEAIRWFDIRQDSVCLNLTALLEYGLEKMRRNQSIGSIVQVKVEPGEEQAEVSPISIFKADVTAETALCVGMLSFCRSHPDSDLCSQLCAFLAHSFPAHRLKAFPGRINMIIKQIKNTYTRLNVHDQRAALSSLTRLRTKLQNLSKSEKGRNKRDSDNFAMPSNIRLNEVKTEFGVVRQAKVEVIQSPRRSSGKRKTCTSPSPAPVLLKSPKKEILSQALSTCPPPSLASSRRAIVSQMKSEPRSQLIAPYAFDPNDPYSFPPSQQMASAGADCLTRTSDVDMFDEESEDFDLSMDL